MWSNNLCDAFQHHRAYLAAARTLSVHPSWAALTFGTQHTSLRMYVCTPNIALMKTLSICLSIYPCLIFEWQKRPCPLTVTSASPQNWRDEIWRLLYQGRLFLPLFEMPPEVSYTSGKPKGHGSISTQI